jgi:hypothetical protein
MPGGRGASPYDGIVTMAPVEGNRNLFLITSPR